MKKANQVGDLCFVTHKTYEWCFSASGWFISSQGVGSFGFERSIVLDQESRFVLSDI